MNVGIIPYCEIIPDSRGRRALVYPEIYTCRSTGRHGWEGFTLCPNIVLILKNKMSNIVFALRCENPLYPEPARVCLREGQYLPVNWLPTLLVCRSNSLFFLSLFLYLALSFLFSLFLSASLSVTIFLSLFSLSLSLSLSRSLVWYFSLKALNLNCPIIELLTHCRAYNAAY